jgi:MFS family permease
MITAFTLPGIIITPFVGLAADRLGRRNVIIPLLFLFGISGSAISIVKTFEIVILLRLAQGIGGSALITLSVTLIGDIYEDQQQDRIIGVNSAAISIGSAVYPLIGGVLASFFWYYPFLFYAIGVVVGISAVLLLPEPDYSSEHNLVGYIHRMERAMLYPKAIGVFLSVFLSFFLFYGAILTSFPLVLDERFALTPSQIGILLSTVSVGTAGASFQFDRIRQWKEGFTIIRVGFILYGISLISLYAISNLYLFLIPLLLFGVGTGLIVNSADKILVELVPGDLRAGTIGIRTGFLRLGQTAGPIGFTILVQFLYDSTVEGYYTLFALAGIISILLPTLVTLLPRQVLFALPNQQ